MDVNARTGKREKRGVRSKGNKIRGACGRDTLNDNGELLLTFANNHDLALVNKLSSTPKGGVSHTFNGRGTKRIDYILTRERDHKLVRNVTVHPQPSSFLPISDHSIVSAPVKLLGHFARNCRLRTPARPPVDRRRLVTDPQVRQEVDTAVGRHIRANPPGDQQCGRRGSRIRRSHHADRLIGDPTPGTKETRAGLEWRRPNEKLSCRLRLMRCTQRGSA